MTKQSVKKEKWNEVLLKDIGVIFTGRTPSKRNPEYWGRDLMFVTPSDIKTDQKYIMNTNRYLSMLGEKKFQKILLPTGSILVTCIGSDMGKVIINTTMCVSNQQINSVVVNDKYNNNFIYYLLKNARNTLRLNAQGGSTMPIINKTDFGNLSFNIPDLDEQNKIASVLSSLDNKIELLRKQNETLEEIAQTLFNEWFVEFNFPNKDGKPYKKSGGKMIDSELGKIPEGWEVKQLEKLSKVVCGKTPSKSNHKYFGGGRHFIKIPDMHGNTFVTSTADTLTEEGVRSQENKTVPQYAICVSCIATVGLVSITTEPSQTNQQINSVIPDDAEYRYYLYLLLKTKERYLKDMASGGTATLNLNTGNFLKIEVVCPDKNTLSQFSDISDSIFKKILSNFLEIKELNEVRDMLLPKLIAGEIQLN